MLEIIKEQFKSGKSLTQSRYYSYVNRGNWPKFFWDFHPLGQEYYHELNPYFLFQVYRPDIYKFSKVITVRDGFLTLSTYLLNHFREFNKHNNTLLFIHPNLAPIIPTVAMESFGQWHIVQKKQITLSEAKRVIIFGLVSEEYLGPLENLPKKLQSLNSIHPKAKIELLLPMRKEIFGKNSQDKMAIYHLLNHLKDALRDREIHFLRTEDFFEISHFKETYFYDLAHDQMIISDNYLHYLVQSKGGTVNNHSLTNPPQNSFFSFDLSVFHEFHLSPIHKIESIFPELIFYKKTNPHQDLNFDPFYQKLLKKLLTNHPQ